MKRKIFKIENWIFIKKQKNIYNYNKTIIWLTEKYVGMYDIFVFSYFFSENSSSSHYIVLASGVDKLVTSLDHYNHQKNQVWVQAF